MGRGIRAECIEIAGLAAKAARLRWIEATGGDTRQTIVQGMRLGALAWLAYLVAAYAIKTAVNLKYGHLWSPSNSLVLTWMGVLLVHCVTSLRWVKVAALLVGLSVGLAIGLDNVLSYSGPFRLGFTLSMVAPEHLPLFPLLFWPSNRPIARRGRHVLWGLLAVMAIFPIAWVRNETFWQFHLSHMICVIAFLAVVVTGWFDPRAAVAGVILTVNHSAKGFFQSTGSIHQDGLLESLSSLSFNRLLAPFTTLDLLLVMLTFAILAISKARLTLRLGSKPPRTSE